jgi:glycerophosphoryl diester phosphodiesterase
LLDSVPGLRAVVWHYEILDPALIAVAGDRGVESFAYSVKTRTEHERCAELGLDAVITDHPEYLIESSDA